MRPRKPTLTDQELEIMMPERWDGQHGVMVDDLTLVEKVKRNFRSEEWVVALS